MAFISIYMKPEDKQKKKFLIVTITLILITSLISSGVDISYRKKDKKTEDIRFLELKEDNSTLEKYILVLLNGYGYNKSVIDVNTITPSIMADKAIRDLYNQAGKPSTIINIEYFLKDVDPVAIKKVLNNLGFNVTIKNPINTYSTNQIWFGNEVRITDVKLVALSLIRAGVSLKSIRRFNNNDVKKNRLIQIGSSPNVLTNEVLSIDDVMSLRK